MENNIEKIKKACIQANPSILKLEFGCQLKCSDPDKKYPSRSIFRALSEEFRWEDGTMRVLTEDFPQAGVPVENLEILGRKIGLVDVLKATEEKWRTMYGVPENPLGNVPLREGQMLYYIISKWDLLKSLEDQSEPTISFLAGLLADNK